MRLGSKSPEKRDTDKLNAIVEERKYLLTVQNDFFLTEAYKALRTNVVFSLTGESACKVITVTSSIQSEGKTTTAVNLGLSFDAADKRVLIIDCDMRKPKLARLLQMNAPAGLSNILMEPQLLDSAVLKYADTNMKVILAGNIPPNPSELLASSRMTNLLENLKQEYDYIILDSPPINMVTDAVIIGNQTDGVLFVVRAGHAERGGVQHALDQLEYAHAKILGFVLNGAITEGRSYGRYGRYSYKRYGYGYRQHQDQQDQAGSEDPS